MNYRIIKDTEENDEPENDEPEKISPLDRL